MTSNIRRKFLVVPGAWRPDAPPGVPVRQGYLSNDPARTVRIRVAGEEGFLTIKGITRGIERVQFEFPIPLDDASRLLDSLCLHPLLVKRRYREFHGGRRWEIDVFEGENDGLVVAKVELASSVELVALPSWVGPEVSEDPRYSNSNLVRHPCSTWREARGVAR